MTSFGTQDLVLKEELFQFERDFGKGEPDVKDPYPWDFQCFLEPSSAKLVKDSLCISYVALFSPSDVPNNNRTHLIVEQGLAQQCLSRRTTEYLTKTDGTFARTETLADGAGQQQVKLIQRLDANAQVVGIERVVGDETRTYALQRDALGRVTQVTRPDGSVIERTYHGFSNQLTQLKVDGKIIATQTVAHGSTLKSRQVGRRRYSFDEDTVTLPDKTRLTTSTSEQGVQWSADGNLNASLTRKDGTATVTTGDKVDAPWTHSFTPGHLPGRVRSAQTSPRAEAHGVDWQSLRGTRVASLRTDGHWQRCFVDTEGRVLRTCQDHEDVAYRYDALGQLKSRQVQALKAGEQWQVLSEHNGLGQEVERTFLHNGVARFSQHLSWRGDGRLASKASYREGQLTCTERFSYDALDRLKRYTCEADAAVHCPTDANGQAVKAQDFTWDALDNLVSCLTTGFDGSTRTQTFTYDPDTDPTLTCTVQHGAQSVALPWSDNGYLQADTQGRTLGYTATGQLKKVNDASGTLLTSYEYDGYQRLVAQYVKRDDSTRELRYDGDALIGEVWFDKDRTITRRTSLSPGLAQYDGEQVRWLISDPQAGVAGQVSQGELALAPLLPFGEGAVLSEVVSGYNGMRRDPVTGQYHAGNGYRSYDPSLCRYAQPDWLAPVGEGGYNPYQHCPDPVNLHDPSGAITISRWGQERSMQELGEALAETQTMQVGGRWRGMALSLALTLVGVVASVFSGGTAAIWLFATLTALSLVSFGLEVASVFTAQTHPKISRYLSIASMVTGILSASCFIGPIKLAWSLCKGGLRLIKGAARMLNAGRKAAWQSLKRMFTSRLGVIGKSLRLSMIQSWRNLRANVAKLARRIREYSDVRGMPLEPMPTYKNNGWYGKLRSAWDGPDPLKLTGQAARFYEMANYSRFASGVFMLVGVAIEVNIVRGTTDSSVALANQDNSVVISPRGRSRRHHHTPYKPKVYPRFDLWKVLGLSQ